MWGAHTISDAPWYRELNIMNRVLNKDDCPESYRHCTVRPFSDVFNLASCMQGFPVKNPETKYSGTVPQPHLFCPPCRDFGGLMHDK
jgi:hypothetical protein